MSTQNKTMQRLTPEQFRNKLACLTDKSISNDIVKHSLIEEAVDFVSELPRFYSDQLERMQIWERIGNGILASATKCNNDIGLFINSLLTYIKAEPSKVAASDRLSMFITNFESRDQDWKNAFIKQFQNFHYLIIVKSRVAWNAKKGDKNA